MTPLRSELSRFYGSRLHALREEFMARCRAALDAAIPKFAPAIVQKRMRYGVIAENVTPVLFRNTAFFGALEKLTDNLKCIVILRPCRILYR